jgi:hypothetical protein
MKRIAMPMTNGKMQFEESSAIKSDAHEAGRKMINEKWKIKYGK